MRKIALVFPPQWDPRQPPLAPAVLASCLERAGAQVEVFDLNLRFYRRFLAGTAADHPEAEEMLLKRYLDPGVLKDVGEFRAVSDQIQTIFNRRCAESGAGELFWDGWKGPWSPDHSEHWRAILTDPERWPAAGWLREELRGVCSGNPDFVFVSAIADTQVAAALATASLLARENPSCRVILGGDAFAYRQSILGNFPWLFDSCAAIGIGDGEPVAEGIAGGRPIADIANLFCRRPDGGFSSVPSQFGELQGVNPTVFSTGFSRYLCPEIVVPVETARGCPWGLCSFCIHPNRISPDQGVFREKPVSEVMREVEWFVDRGFRSFFFIDEAILPARLELLAERISARGLPIRWICYSRLDGRHSDRIFRKARAAGCRKIFFGFETAAAHLLSRFRKGTEPATQKRVLTAAGAAGIAVHLFLMTGFPGETRDDQYATGEALREILPCHDPFSFTYDLFPLWAERETELFAQPWEFGTALRERPGADAAYQFRLELPETDRLPLLKYDEYLGDLVRSVYGHAPGLRDLHLSQDSLHLLLMAARD
jgi:hypothetical protein